MTDKLNPSSEAVANRRLQLARWIQKRCDNLQTVFIASTNDGKTQVNQGELSGLLRTKSFGEKRARSLEQQAGMPNGYLDAQPQQATPEGWPHKVMEPSTIEAARNVKALSWPFVLVSRTRLQELKKQFGAKRGAEAMHDIDKTLEIAVLKWEREASQTKRPQTG